jgi:hypothetical protein
MSASTKGVRTLQSQASGYVTSPSIRVNVGQAPDDKDYFVHQDLICPRSEFFKNAMKEPWKEAQERKVDLSEEDPGTFALYLELLYVSRSQEVKETCLETNVLVDQQAFGEYLHGLWK